MISSYINIILYYSQLVPCYTTVLLLSAGLTTLRVLPTWFDPSCLKIKKQMFNFFNILSNNIIPNFYHTCYESNSDLTYFVRRRGYKITSLLWVQFIDKNTFNLFHNPYVEKTAFWRLSRRTKLTKFRPIVVFFLAEEKVKSEVSHTLPTKGQITDDFSTNIKICKVHF